MLRRLDKQSRSAAQEAAQTQAVLNEKELCREVRKSDTQDTASRSQACQQSVRCTRMRDVRQTPSAKTRLARKSRERQPTERRRECVKHERERAVWLHHKCRPVDQCTHRSESRRDHEAQSQVKKKDSCRK